MLVFFLQEVSLGVLDSSDQSGILSAFECIMSHIYQPCLTALETWGELDSDPNGRKIRSTFMDSGNGSHLRWSEGVSQ
jgi:hypothetical protein